jgi:hypothetical protein
MAEAFAPPPEDGKIRPHIQALIDSGCVSLPVYRELRGNSWEWEALVPVLSQEAFIEHLEHNLRNCEFNQRRPFVTYNDSLAGLLAPECVRRLREKQVEIARITDLSIRDDECKRELAGALFLMLSELSHCEDAYGLTFSSKETIESTLKKWGFKREDFVQRIPGSSNVEGQY